MISLEIVKGKRHKKKQKLLIDGHYFIKITVREDITYWCCDKRVILQCNSVVRTCLVNNAYEIVYGPTEHNHEDPKNRKLIVATPRKSIVRKSLKASLTQVLDFEDHSTTLEHGQSDAGSETLSPNKKKKKLKDQDIPFVSQPIEAAFDVQEIKFVRWKKSQQHKLFIDGYYYSLRSLTETTSRWACSYSTANCTGLVTTCFTSGAHKLENDPKSVNHTHSITDIPVMLRPYHTQVPLPNDKEAKATPIKEKRIPQIPFVDQPIEQNFGLQEIKFIRWKENQQHKLFIDGFYYSLRSMTQTTCKWICAHYSAHCTALMTTFFVKGWHKLKDDPSYVKHTHDVTDVPKTLRKYVEMKPLIEHNKENIKPPAQCKREVLQVKIPEQAHPVKPAVKKHLTDFEEQHDEPRVTKNLADVSMHTQLLNLIPQGDVVEFQPPVDCEVEFVILFGLRRQMTPEQIFYELQGVYGLDAPSFEVVLEHCERFRGGYYPKNEPDPKWTNDSQLANVKANLHEDPDISKELLIVQPDI